MSDEPDKAELIKYLKGQCGSEVMVWLNEYPVSNRDGPLEWLHPMVSYVETMLNESKLTVREIENLYTLIIPTFPEGLWFLFSIINHPDIDNRIYIKKMYDCNFTYQYYNKPHLKQHFMANGLTVYRDIIKHVEVIGHDE